MTDVKMYNTKHAALQFSPETFSKMMIDLYGTVKTPMHIYAKYGDCILRVMGIRASVLNTKQEDAWRRLRGMCWCK